MIHTVQSAVKTFKKLTEEEENTQKQKHMAQSN
jgi:Sec-independent protein translocase protein TatA